MISSTGILTVNLTAIQSNWLYVASLLRNSSECAVVLKADAYGVGAVEVATALYDVGCRYFYVVTLHEAVELRGVVPHDAVIYVLGGVPEGMASLFVEHQLVPVLYSSSKVKQWLAYCEYKNAAHPCVLKVNTGMTRLGLDESELDELLVGLRAGSYLNPVLLMSHLACADQPAHPLNDEQLERFTAAVTRIKTFFPKIKTSLANSSGTFLGDAYHFDMVRIGAALYGINPQSCRLNPLSPVISLRLPVLQIRTAERSESVGYGATVSVSAGVRLAVVAGGYADGIHRSLGLSPKGQVDGLELNSVGRISMDSFVFDVTHVPMEPDYIEVINSKLNLDYLMSENKMLGYELLTSLGQRFQRQYVCTGGLHE